MNIEKEKTVLAIPEVCVDKMIALNHSSLFVGHQGVVKTYLTMSDKIFIPDLMHYLRSYIKGCHICQLSNKDKIPSRHFQRRINLNYKPLSRLSMDLKVMPKSYRGHKFILCVIDEMTNYLITMPIYQARSEEIGDSLIDNVISKFGIPEYLIMDQDSSFMSTIMNYLFRKLNIKIKTVAPFNHKSLQAEHGIKSLSTMLTKHLTEQGQMWPKYPNPQNPQNPQNPPNPPNPPNQSNPMDLPNPPQPQQMNWSYFKPEFSGKAEEDAAAHLLKTNDWMDTYNLSDDIKVRRFCLTLIGEARLWYESLKPIDVDWNALLECFRQQYSKFGSSREQYFHMWRSFRYDENEDTIDSCILKVKQVASLLNYGEPEILELFKNTLPSKLYWILFPIKNLREAVDTAKRVMNKEKLDKQLTGQASNISPIMK